MSTDLEFQVPLKQIAKLASVRLKPLAQGDLSTLIQVWQRVTMEVSDCVFDDHTTASQRIVNLLMKEIGVFDCSVRVSSTEKNLSLFTIAIKMTPASKMEIQTYEIRYNTC